MKGNFIDTIRLKIRKAPMLQSYSKFIETDFGKLRVLDTQGSKPCIISVPDGPNVIEHHLELIEKLSANYRVICFEFPGLGFSYPNFTYDYSFERAAKIILQLMDILKVKQITSVFTSLNQTNNRSGLELATEL